MRLSCVIACFMVVSTCVAQSPEPVSPQGHIIGLVVNDLNEPIGLADICTSVVLTNSSTTSCGQKADQRGHFDITVPVETNRVFAEKQDAGYLQPATQRIGYGVPVKLTETQPVAHVTIKIGPQPAEIDLTVTDKATGRPVDSFMVHWMRIDDRGLSAFVQTNKNRVFVPPNSDLLLSVLAQGFQRWFYYDVSSPSYPILRLSSGEQRTVNVELEPH